MKTEPEYKASYRHILRSTSILGSSAGIAMVLSLIKTKFAAILIGSGGVGLQASFTTMQVLISTVAGLGISSSGVRDVAQAVAKNDEQLIGRTVLTLRRMCWLTGLLGMTSMMLLSPFLSQLTFNSDQYTLEIATLGLNVLFGQLINGQVAFLRGMGRIGDIARLTIIGALILTILSILFYYWLGLYGIVPALVLAGALRVMVNLTYVRRVPLASVSMEWSESFHEAGSMVKLGISMMWVGLLSNVVKYATIAMISGQFNLEAVGIYSAALALSGIFINFILNTMATDYYPRLSAVADDRIAMSQTINQQTEIALLMAVPGILLILALGPWIVQLFYSQEFLPSISLLDYFLLGSFFRIVAWPLMFVMLALSKGKMYAFLESVSQGFYLLLLIVWLPLLGVEGVAIAFLASNFVSAVITFAVVRHLIGFSWSSSCHRLLAVYFPLLSGCFLFVHNYRNWEVTTAAIIVAFAAAVMSLRKLVTLSGTGSRISKIVSRIPGIRG